jgi:hypothetical protein
MDTEYTVGLDTETVRKPMKLSTRRAPRSAKRSSPAAPAISIASSPAW